MTSYVDAARSARPITSRAFLWPLVMTVATLAAYFPTILGLVRGPWQTEQEGHGPLIIAAALFLVWQRRSKLAAISLSPAPIVGWFVLICGLLLMFLSRTQDVLTTETFSILPVIVGEVLLLAGWSTLRVLAFPIAFLIFAVPAPDWIIDSITVPLKVVISDVVTQVLYHLGYPIAQNGVMIMIGSYQLLVKDACSGMNSIFALSAIGLFYVYEFRWDSKLRGIILLAAIIPITIFANFIRVLALVLIAYYGGIELIDGVLHDFTGIALFVVAIVLMFATDGLLSALVSIGRKLRPRTKIA